MSLEDQIRTKFGKGKIEPVIHLTPPPETISDYGGIDFNKIADSSEFKRFVYMLRTGKTHRGSKIDLDQKLRKTEEDINIVKQLGRGSDQDKLAVIEEFKSKLALVKRKAKIDSST